jgi:hypothetical protein
LIAEIQRALRGYRPTIHQRNWDYDYNIDSYARGIGYCGQPVVGAGTGRIFRIHYWEFSDEVERNNELGTVLCDITEAPEGEG